jgi:Tfp pilus assembly protein PilF
MKRTILGLVAWILLATVPASSSLADSQAVRATGKYVMGDHDSKADARKMALDDVKGAIQTLRGGDPSAAKEKLDAILARDPDNLHAILIRARALGDLGKYAEALADLDRALALEPNQARAHMGRGQLLIKTGDTEGALKSFTEALSLDPKNARGYYFTGMAQMKLKRPRIAFRYLDRACRMGDDKACEKTEEMAKRSKAMQMRPRKITMPAK